VPRRGRVFFPRRSTSHPMTAIGPERSSSLSCLMSNRTRIAAGLRDKTRPIVFHQRHFRWTARSSPLDSSHPGMPQTATNAAQSLHPGQLKSALVSAAVFIVANVENVSETA
jgi:hypothetical protein